MNLQLFLELSGFIVLVGGLVLNYGQTKGRSENIEENLNKKIDQHIVDDDRNEAAIKNQMAKLWEWKDSHERDASNMRLELQKQIGKIEAGVQIHDGQYSQIISLITSMKEDFADKFDDLKASINRNKN